MPWVCKIPLKQFWTSFLLNWWYITISLQSLRGILSTNLICKAIFEQSKLRNCSSSFRPTHWKSLSGLPQPERPGSGAKKSFTWQETTWKHSHKPQKKHVETPFFWARGHLQQVGVPKNGCEVGKCQKPDSLRGPDNGEIEWQKNPMDMKHMETCYTQRFSVCFQYQLRELHENASGTWTF